MAQGPAKKIGSDHGDLTGLADDDHSFYAKGELGYEQTTSNVSIDNTETTIVSTTATVAADRKIKLIGQVWACTSDTVNGRLDVSIWESSTQFATVRMVATSTSIGRAPGQTVSCRIDSPSAGEHTYILKVRMIDGSAGTVHADSVRPAFLLVEDNGGS